MSKKPLPRASVVVPQEILDDPSMEIVVSVSGGKDSTAMALWLRCESRLPNPMVFAFCETGHEHPWTHEHLDMLEKKLATEILRLEGPFTFITLCEKKQRFPSVKARFCTEELKVKVLAAWVDARLGRDGAAEVCVAQGVRAEESASRAELPTWQVGDFHGFKNAYDCPIWRPILGWTWQDVFAIHERHAFPPNQLYLRGARRVGCFPCIHSSKEDLRAAFLLDPALLERLRSYEERVIRASARGAGSFFANDKTPPRYHDKSAVGADGETYTYPSIDAVYRWAMEPESAPLFAGLMPEPPTCMSAYGLCE